MSNHIFNQRNLFKKVIENSRIFAIFLLGTIVLITTNLTAQAATFTVTKTADTNDGACNADCSLREAINAASSVESNDTIEFDSSVFSSPQIITLSGTQLTIENHGSLTVNGTGANLLKISGGNQSRVFFIEAGANVTLNSLTITNGNSGSGHGGGIFIDGTIITTLNISNSV